MHSMLDLIADKKAGEENSRDQLRWFCREYARGKIPDYQASAWLMAVCCRGMSDRETVWLTEAMVESGETLQWSGLPTVVDKHSTGGVGDKTSLVLVPLVAEAGLTFMKMSGRGLGHTGGTLDKLESIDGFDVSPSPTDLRRQISEVGCALVGQDKSLVPADGLLYALRSATATVDSVPLIASSVMSKKLAGGAEVIVLDVKYGAGTFMTTREEAEVLARAMVQIGIVAGRRVRAVLTPMEEPLGYAVGNALEVREAIETLHGRGPADLRDLCLTLGGHILVLAGKATDLDSARRQLRAILRSGRAADRFARLIAAQGGTPQVVTAPDILPISSDVRILTSPGTGWVQTADARAIAEAAFSLGAGRREKSDSVQFASGVLLRAKPGDRVNKGDPLAEIHAGDSVQNGGEAPAIERAMDLVSRSMRISETPVSAPEHSTVVIGA